jgi:hypothetical protein
LLRRNAAVIAMLVTHVAVVFFALFFYLRSRVAILAAFQDFGTRLPRAAAIALSPWFLPAVVAVSTLAAVAGLVVPLRRRHRAVLVGSGLLVASVALIFAVGAGFAPLFQPD